MPAPEPASPPQNRNRRAAWIALAAGMLLAVFALRWVSQPSQVAGLILREVGRASGLEITASGASEYRLRGTPMLVLREVVARQPGAGAALLRAERIHLELPWSTIRARGTDLTIKRVELDAPQLDITALQRWLATRPPSETRIPTLTGGLRVVRGRVIGDGWSVDALDFGLPSLHPQRPASAHASGRMTSGSTRVPFDLDVALTRPAASAGLGLSGDVSIESAPWALPMEATLSGRLHDGEDGMGLDRLRMAAEARYRNGDTDLPFAFGLAGKLRLRDGVLGLSPLGVAIRGQGPVPTLDGHGQLVFGDALSTQLQGAIANWREAWPPLPPPLGQSSSSLPFDLRYHGRPNLSDVAALRLGRDATVFDGRFRLPQMLDWIDAGAQGSPVPPLAGRLTTPKLEISGAALEGVDIEFGDDTPATP